MPGAASHNNCQPPPPLLSRASITSPLPPPSPPPLAQIPTIGFIYFAGWLGYAGSKYLQEVAKAAKPIEKEIIM